MISVPTEYQSHGIKGFRKVSKDADKKAVRQAFAAWEKNIGGVKFIEVDDPSSALIRIGTYSGRNGLSPGVAGEAEVIDLDLDQSGRLDRADLWLNHTKSRISSGFGPKTDGFEILLHEIGHIVGLKHPGAYDGYSKGPYLPRAEDNRDYTMMSYNRGNSGSQQFFIEPRPYDKLVGQYMYGSGAPAGLWYRPDGTSFDDTIRGLFKAELIQGLQGDDHLIGAGGNDRLEGGSGADTLDGGSGSDTVSYLQSSSAVKVSLVTGTASIGGDAEGDTLLSIEGLLGSRFNDELTGNDHNNAIDGGGGADTMQGGAGNDTYYVNTSLDQVLEFGDQGRDTVYASVSYALGSTEAVEILRTISLTAKTAINLSGSSVANTILGNAGANRLDGKEGADSLYGYGGNDTYYVDTAGDRVVETSSGGAADRVYTEVSYTLAKYVEHLYASGSSSISLTGNTLANTIKGNAGDNAINGGLGKDTLYGGANKDTFVFNTKLSSSNVDKLADYKVADDSIQLDNKYMTKLKVGELASSAFWKGSKAHDASDRIIYDTAKGYLYYDADGTGSSKQVLIATMSKNLKMVASEFTVI